MNYNMQHTVIGHTGTMKAQLMVLDVIGGIEIIYVVFQSIPV